MEYVSIKQMDAESMKLASEVTTHIRTCRSCLRQVRAWQLIEDGMEQQLHESLRRRPAPDKVQTEAPREPILEHPGIDS